MRTKTLLIAAAALAAGVISSQAQPVYSANIVGYVNQTAAPGYNSQPTPLDVAGGNALTNIFPNVYNAGNGYGPLDGDQVLIWQGHSFLVVTLDSTLSTGVGDQYDTPNNPQPVPTINPGELIYFDNVNSGFTNTVVGTVHADIAPTGSQIAGVNTNQLTPGFNFVSSKLPIAGGLESVLGFTNVYNASLGYGPLDGDQIYIPNIVGGQFKGYKITTIDSTESTGYGDQYDTPNHAQPEPVIPVGGGFIFNNVNSTTVWVQSL